MKEKFTKGPWVFDKYRNLKANGELLKTEGVRIPCGHSREETQANMNLIAAAPDMYEMLQKIADRTVHDFNYATAKPIYDLLAKAPGSIEIPMKEETK